jgi:hypothetical protein
VPALADAADKTRQANRAGWHPRVLAGIVVHGSASVSAIPPSLDGLAQANTRRIGMCLSPPPAARDASAITEPANIAVFEPELRRRRHSPFSSRRCS